MALNNGAQQNLRKRKMKEMMGTAAQPPPPQPATNFLMLQRQQFPSHFSTALPLNINGNIAQRMKASPAGGFSGQSKQATFNNDHDKENISAIIKYHGEQLRRSFTEMLCKHYNSLAFTIAEMETKKRKEKDVQVSQVMIKNAQLNKMVAHLKQEALAAKIKVKALENTVSELKLSLNEAKLRATTRKKSNMSRADTQHEDAESSFVDPDRRVEPIRLACKACDKKLATMMLWPCYHVALCTKCDAKANVCPVCAKAKTMMSIELDLPQRAFN